MAAQHPGRLPCIVRLTVPFPGRAESFDFVAEEYAAVRPGYPESMYEYLIRDTGLDLESPIVEVGCGTAHATLPFAKRGFKMLCVEPGARLAAIARKTLQPFPNVTVERSRFEDWDPVGRRFALLFSAQAYHWIDQAIALAKPYEVLRPGGTVALVWNVARRDPSPLRTALDSAYERHAPALTARSDGAAQTIVGLFAKSKLYSGIGHETFAWVRQYSAIEYIRLLGTFSDHWALGDDERVGLFREIETAIDQVGGFIELTYDTVCHVYRTVRKG